MKFIAGRSRRALAVALTVMNLGSVRAIAVQGPCEHCRSFFAPALTIKALAKAATHQQWKQPAPQALGEGCLHLDIRELASNRAERAVAVAAAWQAFPLDIAAPRAGPALARKLPTDQSPVQHSRLLI